MKKSIEFTVTLHDRRKTLEKETLFHDEYTGPRWTYGMKFRPLQIGAQPKGWIVGSYSLDSRYRHGTIDYPFRLTEKECGSYELELVK